MNTIKCSEEGCSYTATHAQAAVAKRMLGMHKRHVHGILGREAIRQNEKGQSRLERKRERQRIWAQKKRDALKQEPYPIQVNFCPCCGFNLKILVAAFAVAAKHSQ